MARPKKPKIEKTIQFKAGELKVALSRVAIAKSSAKEHSGMAGETKRAFCEKNGITTKAFDFVVYLMNQDHLKAQNILEEAIMLFEIAGGNDQASLFDNVAQRKARDLMTEKDEDEEDVRPAFLKNAMPLDKAEEAFNAANEVAAAKRAVAAKDKAKRDAKKDDAPTPKPSGLLPH